MSTWINLYDIASREVRELYPEWDADTQNRLAEAYADAFEGTVPMTVARFAEAWA